MKPLSDFVELKKLVEFGFDPVAVDIPGRGESVGKPLSDDEKSEENVEFWDAFVKAMKLDRPILVSASISHRFIMGWLNKHKSDGKIRAWVALAPMSTHAYPRNGARTSIRFLTFLVNLVAKS